MGQKVHPHGLRVGVIEGWKATWFAGKKDFGVFLKEDHTIRTFLKNKYYAYGISKINIERPQGKVVVNIFTIKPGMIIGQKGAGVEVLKKEVQKLVGTKTLHVNIMEVKRPDLDSVIVAESIAVQLEKRASFRRTMKQAMSRVMRSGAKGVKVMVSGRLDGAEIARAEHYHEGSIPLQTLRANIDYGVATARTTFGAIGVKVWIYKGEVLDRAAKKAQDLAEQQAPREDRKPFAKAGDDKKA